MTEDLEARCYIDLMDGPIKKTLDLFALSPEGTASKEKLEEKQISVQYNI